MQTQWNRSVLPWWRHDGGRRLQSDQSLCVRTFKLWVAWLDIGMWWVTIIHFFIIFVCVWLYIIRSHFQNYIIPIFRKQTGKKIFTDISQISTFMEVISYGQQGFMFNLCWETRLCPELDVWALWRSIVVHLVACGFSFHISLFPTIATGTTQPARRSARDLEKLEWLTQAQTETFTSFILCMWLFNICSFLIYIVHF